MTNEIDARIIEIKECPDCHVRHTVGVSHWCKYAEQPTNGQIMLELLEIKRLLWLRDPGLPKVVDHINAAGFYDD